MERAGAPFTALKRRMSGHTTGQLSTGSRPWRRCARFSVRTLLASVLVIGGGLGWFSYRAQIQREAVATVIRAGGSVRYYSEWLGFPGAPGRGFRARQWLVDGLGVDYFYNVVEVSFLECAAADPDMVRIGRLNRLVWLFLRDAKITDRDLANLEGLTELSWLALNGTSMTDAGLFHLRGLTHLEVLSLDDTKISDAGLFHLKRLTSLGELSLTGTRVNGTGFIHLEKLTNLEQLYCDDTEVNDDAPPVHRENGQSRDPDPQFDQDQRRRSLTSQGATPARRPLGLKHQDYRPGTCQPGGVNQPWDSGAEQYGGDGHRIGPPQGHGQSDLLIPQIHTIQRRQCYSSQCPEEAPGVRPLRH